MLKRIRELFISKGSPKKKIAPSAPAPAVEFPAPPEQRAERRPPVHRGPSVVHNPIPDVDLDPDAVKILKRLTRFDHTAYLVGGCVRDLLLDRKPKDFDIGTSATPRQVKRLFSNCRIIGRRFRLAHIYFQNGKILEVATFRALDAREDEETDKGEDILIRDDNVFGTPEEDALRRDFTVNQLFYDVNAGTVLDHADGLGDLRRRVVRTIGDPDIRFREDPIRILRAIKFAARLDFTIEEETLAALRRTRVEIPKAAPPRVLEEINRFCRGGAARRSFEWMFDTGVFDVVLEEVAENYRNDEKARALLLSCLESFDRRFGDGEVATGEIFAALFLPLLAQRIGWEQDGSTKPPPRGLDLRTLPDDWLRPMALRLRVPRREQERCRQALATLVRMVPFATVRRAAKRGLPQRGVFADAMALLAALAERYGGEYRTSLDAWTAAVAGAPVADRGVEAPGEEKGEERGTGRRRRRRRGSRGRGRDDRAEPVAEGSPAQAERPRAEPAPKKPAKWDDEYFFSALPSVPDLGAPDEGDRYGATTVAPEERRAEEPGAPPRKRRRRRRKKGTGTVS